MKPGIYTTEFWITLIGNVLAFAVALGVVTTSDKSTLEGALTTIVMGVPALLGAVKIIVSYIQGRVTVKTAEASGVEAVALAEIPDEARQAAKAVNMPIVVLLWMFFKHRDKIADLLEAIRNWRK
jgi:hypothetical protein